MSKKVLSIILAVVMLVSMATVAGVSASAATAGGTISVDLPETWAKSATAVYCHIWQNGGDSLYAWQAKDSKMEQVDDDTYSYEIPAGKELNMIIISTSTGMQTYDLTFGDPCMGDTILIDTDNPIENPVDSEKSTAKATWKNNSANYGPHLAVTSVGNIVGEQLAEGESAEDLVAAFETGYPDLATPEKIAELEKSLGISSGGDDETPESADTTTTPSGTTTTGDTTQVLLLSLLLVAALGVVFVSVRKRATK